MRLKLIILVAIILLEGFVTISVEILTIRQLIPFVGNNVVVTSLIIGVFLLFLALGYRKGGEYQTNFQDILARNFMWTAWLLGIGLSYFFIAVFFIGAERVLPKLAVLTLYLCLVIAPIVYLLGQTVPIITNLFKSTQHIGAISGRVLFLSTLGSFAGAVLTSLLLFSLVGVAWTVVFNVAALCLLVLCLNSNHYTKVFVMLCCLAFVYVLNIVVEKNVFVKTTHYANYHVQEDYQERPCNPGKLLVINDSASSFINPQKQAAEYIELLKKILFAELKLQNKEILVLGAGGFTVSAQSTYNNHFTYFDIDKAIKDIVEEHFLKPINGDFVAEDARVFLTQHANQYDVIISDAYKGRFSVPAYLLTKEHMLNIRKALKADGIAAFNVIANPFLSNAYSKRVDNTIRSVFQNCMSMPLHYTNALTNIIYICKKQATETDAVVYLDNHNKATMDYFLIT